MMDKELGRIGLELVYNKEGHVVGVYPVDVRTLKITNVSEGQTGWVQIIDNKVVQTFDENQIIITKVYK